MSGVSGMGIPLAWHRRHALLLASQLPENTADAKLVLIAVTELVDTFMANAPADETEKPSNILPFVSG